MVTIKPLNDYRFNNQQQKRVTDSYQYIKQSNFFNRFSTNDQ